MHQVAGNVFIGVPPTEWDDAVNIANTTHFEFGNLTQSALDLHPRSEPSTSTSLSVLEKRPFNNQCRQAMQCVYTMGRPFYHGVGNAVEAIVAYFLAQSTWKNFWQFFVIPVVISTTAGIGPAGFSGYIAAMTSIRNGPKSSPPVSSCSDNQKDVEVFRAAVQGAIAQWEKSQYNELHDLGLSITVDGGTQVNMSISMRPANNVLPEVCGPSTIR